MHSIRKGTSHYQWEPEEKVTEWDLMSREEKYTSLERWYRKLAHQHGNANTYDDLVQEAAIAAWQCLCDKPEIHKGAVMAAAKHRVLAVVYREAAHTGSPRPKGSQTVRASSQDPLVPENWTAAVLSDLRAAQELERVEMAQVEAEIRTAVRALETADRELVYWVFWEQLNYKEAGKVLALSQQQVTKRFNYRVRPALRGRLGHLAPEVAPSEGRHVWTARDDERLIELCEQGLTRPEISREMGINKTTIARHERRLGVTPAPSRIGGAAHRQQVTQRELLESVTY